MEVIDFLDNVKIEKANAVLKYNRLCNIAKLFRLMELCLVFICLSWISSHLPIAVRVSGECFKLLLSFVLSPIFIFVLCNLIVIALLANSGKLSGQFAAVSQTDLFENFLETSVSLTPEPIVCEDKIMNKPVTVTVTEAIDPVASEKVLRRSSSENMKIVCLEKQSRKLRRSETEKSCRVLSCEGDISKEKEEIVEELSNEEFQRTIEAFIARQLKFHREEKSAIVAPNEGCNDSHI